MSNEAIYVGVFPNHFMEPLPVSYGKADILSQFRDYALFNSPMYDNKRTIKNELEQSQTILSENNLGDNVSLEVVKRGFKIMPTKRSRGGFNGDSKKVIFPNASKRGDLIKTLSELQSGEVRRPINRELGIDNPLALDDPVEGDVQRGLDLILRAGQLIRTNTD